MCCFWFIFCKCTSITLVRGKLTARDVGSIMKKLFLVFHLILYMVGTSHLSISKHWYLNMGFPGSSVGKFPCNVGDPGSIPREQISYPLQYSWASLVAQIVNTLPAMQETWIRSLGWEDTLEDGLAIHSSILAWRIPMDRRAWWATVHAVAKSQRVRHNWATKQSMP